MAKRSTGLHKERPSLVACSHVFDESGGEFGLIRRELLEICYSVALRLPFGKNLLVDDIGELPGGKLMGFPLFEGIVVQLEETSSVASSWLNSPIMSPGLGRARSGQSTKAAPRASALRL